MKTSLAACFLASAVVHVVFGLFVNSVSVAQEPQPAATPPIPTFNRSLASFSKSNANQQCYDRKTEPYTAITDAHSRRTVHVARN